MWYVRDVLYAVLYVRVSCFVVRGCGVLRRYIDVCYCDMFSVVNVYLDHLKFCIVCINSRRYVCCSECDVVSNECNDPTSCLVQPIGAHCCEVMYFWCFGFRGELGFLKCDDVCMCVVNKQFELLEFVCSNRHSLQAPNDTSYKRWSCHSGLKLMCKLCRTSPPPAMGARFTVFGHSGHADPLDVWRCC